MLQSPVPLHIPDGFLTPLVSAIGWILALTMIAIALRQTRNQLGERQIPMMGVLAAFIFAAQAINFPIAAGTSGHLLGGALAAIIMGPWAATLIMTAVIAIQSLLFQDGGLLVMGWNILNMGVFTAFTGYVVYRFTKSLLGRNPVALIAGGFVAAWLSVEVGAIATAFELAASGTSPLSLALPAMAGVHALIGLGEGVITSAALSLLQVSRPQALEMGETAPGRRGAIFVVTAMALSIIVALFSPLASAHPDGLEFVAEQQGFLTIAADAPYSILPDYTIPFIGNPAVTTILAVLVGTLVVFGLALLLGRLTTRRQTTGD
ncbi:MAG TPA: cobalamin biosynthesis protein CbiM [Anaerolineae bacterium]|nr:cobalamin biosynthesis protein CbiM [Anaerolineae bacterium]